MRASALLGAAVENEQGQQIGEIDDLILTKQSDVVTETEPGQAGELGDSAQIRLAMTAEQLLDAEPEFQYDPDRRTPSTAPPGVGRADPPASPQPYRLAKPPRAAVNNSVGMSFQYLEVSPTRVTEPPAPRESSPLRDRKNCIATLVRR